MDLLPSSLDESNIAQAALGRAVVNCNLYGEAGDLPDVVHCETIETRSRLHNWELGRHRHGRLHQVLLVEQGGGTAHLEGRTHTLSPMTGVNVPIGSIHGFTFEPGTGGWVVTLAGETIDDALDRTDPLHRVIGRTAIFGLTEEMRSVTRSIFAEYDGRSFGRAQMLRSQSGILLALVARCLQSDLPAAEALGADPRFVRFERLIEEHFTEHWSVSDYADELGMTATHLTRLARAATGQPASRVIEERVIREARRNLVYTELSVSVVAYALGFSDPAYFSRLFKRATGMSPRRFRELANGGDTSTAA
jgi:AraC family transcriptional activator of pobA